MLHDCHLWLTAGDDYQYHEVVRQSDERNGHVLDRLLFLFKSVAMSSSFDLHHLFPGTTTYSVQSLRIRFSSDSFCVPKPRLQRLRLSETRAVSYLSCLYQVSEVLFEVNQIPST